MQILKNYFWLRLHHDVTNPFMTVITRRSSIVPSLMFVPVAVLEELKQTPRQNCALCITYDSITRSAPISNVEIESIGLAGQAGFTYQALV